MDQRRSELACSMKKIGSSAAVDVLVMLPPVPPIKTWERLCAEVSFWLRCPPKVDWPVMVVSSVAVGVGALGCVPVLRVTEGGASTLKGAPIAPLKEPSNAVSAGYERGSVRQSQ